MAGSWALNLFDRLHIGHHVLIDILSEMPDPVAGITSSELIGEKLELAQLIQTSSLRLENLQRHLEDNALDDIIEVKVITEYKQILQIPGDTRFMMYAGPCCMDIEENALSLRSDRLGVSDSVEYMKPTRANDGDKLASARIRRGEIDRKGQILRGTNELPRSLGEALRSDIQTPKGEVFDAKDGKPEERVVDKIESETPVCAIAVGDVTCATLVSQGYTPDVQVVDGITKRGKYEGSFSAKKEYTIYNPAATIYPEAWSVMDTAINDNASSLIVVEGEEDLMGFPAVLLAPEDSVMLYGQPGVGIVWVPVNDENRKLARGLLDEMPIIEG
ncbi:MAG: DUF359 domain-containing protein [Candidatus Thorarchaeota archaeon]|jgi:uncharacterized protein (UPF0218 family)/phosphopantetheine adenylyltransferase